jgi:hypothetical protein
MTENFDKNIYMFRAFFRDFFSFKYLLNTQHISTHNFLINNKKNCQSNI